MNNTSGGDVAVYIIMSRGVTRRREEWLHVTRGLESVECVMNGRSLARGTRVEGDK